MVQAFDLGLVNQVELSIGLVDDLAVGENTGAVNQPANRPVFSLHAGNQRHAPPRRHARRPNDTRPATRPI